MDRSTMPSVAVFSKSHNASNDTPKRHRHSGDNSNGQYGTDCRRFAPSPVVASRVVGHYVHCHVRRCHRHHRLGMGRHYRPRRPSRGRSVRNGAPRIGAATLGRVRSGHLLVASQCRHRRTGPRRMYAANSQRVSAVVAFRSTARKRQGPRLDFAVLQLCRVARP